MLSQLHNYTDIGSMVSDIYFPTRVYEKRKRAVRSIVCSMAEFIINLVTRVINTLSLPTKQKQCLFLSFLTNGWKHTKITE